MNESNEADAAGNTTNDIYAAREFLWSADCQGGLQENRRMFDMYCYYLDMFMCLLCIVIT